MQNVETKKNVLFLCTGNSARSQMAEAILRNIAGDRYEAHSCGLDPKPIHPLTKKVMEEIGISLANHTSKNISKYLGKLSFNFVITVCEEADSHCPSIWPGALNKLSWPFQDPAAFRGSETEQLSLFRKVRDEIKARIETWLEIA